MQFKLNTVEEKAFKKFEKACEKKENTIPTTTGGRFSIMFTLTSIGVIVNAIDNQTGEQKDITDVTNW
jgi:hypothetical protein